MKPCAYINQGLVEHSIGSFNVVEEKISELYYRVVKRRLEKFDIFLGVEEVKEIIKDVILLHDMGKAGEYYQNQFNDECQPIVRNTSFIYHEVGSALFFFYDYPIENVKKDEIRVLISLATFNHLNAIRGIYNYPLNKFPDRFDQGMIKMKNFGNILLKSLKNKGFVIKSISVNDYDFPKYSDMLNYIAKISGKPFLKLYNLFLAPIMMGDSLDSSLVRSNKRKTKFVKILESELNENSTL